MQLTRHRDEVGRTDLATQGQLDICPGDAWKLIHILDGDVLSVLCDRLLGNLSGKSESTMQG